MCTHLHVDHVGWNTRLENGRWVPTFPNARYVFSERELAYWTALHAKNAIACIADSVLAILDAGKADLVKSDHALNDHVRLVPTPSHTPAHFSVAVGRVRDDAVITGDLIRSRHAIQKSPTVRTSMPNRPLRAAVPFSSATATPAPSAARRTSPTLAPAASPNGAKVSGATWSLLEFAA
jgi:glyoxylase-like metal-dependent hydrolase (beta-lactamase superfamily II)